MPGIPWRRLKQGPLRALKVIGGFDRLHDSAWRQKRLLILCYHGISMDDEHRWNSALYLSQDDLRRRLEILRDRRCSVLPLSVAIERLYAGALPPRSVAVTFDDGFFDFYCRAYPLLREFDVPVTVYLTTLRCQRNLPVFRPVVAYILWKGRGRMVRVPEIGAFDLHTQAGRNQGTQAILAFAAREKLSLTQQHELAARIGAICDVDYPSIAARRLLTIMTPQEVSTLAAAGVDFELHTHTHSTPSTAAGWEREIGQNRAMIEEITHRKAVHFCYPSGRYRAEFVAPLTEQRVVSATTCDPGLASRRSHPLMLPRFVDTAGVSPVEFEAWVTGAATFVSRHRSYGAAV